MSGATNDRDNAGDRLESGGPVFFRQTRIGRYGRHDSWTYRLPRREDLGDSAHPLAGDAAMVFVDGAPLRQVGRRKDLRPDSFFLDQKKGVVYLGADPGRRTVEVSAFTHAIRLINAPGTIIRRLGFAHYASPAQDGSLRADERSRGRRIERNTFAWNAATGLSLLAADCVVRDNLLAYNGQLGLHAFRAHRLLREGNQIVANNQERFDMSWEAGGVKVVFAEGTIWRDNLVLDNLGTGLWCDSSRNVIAGNVRSGVEISHGTGTLNNRVIGNYIGTDVDGRISADTGNQYGGVRLEDGVRYSLVQGNLIGSNVGGIQVVGQLTERNQIIENYIGVGRAGQPIPNSSYGILITFHAKYTQVGPGNVIAYNPHGIRISGDLDNDYHTITRNSIYANERLGIDLAPYAVANPNDRDDRDDGPNDMLNYPVVERASPIEAAGLACARFTVEIFLADDGQGSYGEGKTLVAVTTAGADGRFVVALKGVSAGQYLTATATDALGNTSEFSLNQLVADAPADAPTATPSPTPSPTPTTGPGQALPPAVYLPLIQNP